MFNKVFDIFDQMLMNEKHFLTGDYSFAKNYEDLVAQLQTNVDIIGMNYKTQKTDETSHLMFYLLDMINNEEAKLNNLIMKLENSDVTVKDR